MAAVVAWGGLYIAMASSQALYALLRGREGAGVRRALARQARAVAATVGRFQLRVQGSAAGDAQMTPEQALALVARANAMLASDALTDQRKRLRCELAFIPPRRSWVRRVLRIAPLHGGEPVVLIEEVARLPSPPSPRHASAAAVVATAAFGGGRAPNRPNRPPPGETEDVTDTADDAAVDDEAFVLVPPPARVCTLPKLVNTVLPMVQTVATATASDAPAARSQRAQSDPEEATCCICMDNLADVVLDCTHRFCATCCASWRDGLGQGCPLCRAPLPPEADEWCLVLRGAAEGEAANSNAPLPSGVSREHVWRYVRALPAMEAWF